MSPWAALGPALLWAFGPVRPAAAREAADSRAIREALEAIGSLPEEPEAGPRAGAAAELGRRLFFDPRLSGNNVLSCASCHQPAMGWADGLPRGRGAGQRELRRNVPTILNVRSYPLLFWDGRAKSLEEQALGPIRSPEEMGQDLEELLLELNRVPGYVREFAGVFGVSGISPENLARAVAEFERTVVSSPRSPFGRFRRDRSALTPSQRKGLLLFAGKARCALCHAGPALTDGGFHNVGLKSAPQPDLGRREVLPLPAARKAFKTPSLLDAARTAPYMHDGSIGTLREVVEFYDRGGDDREGLDPLLRPLGLGPDEKSALADFLASLTSPPEPVSVPALPPAWSPASLKEVMRWNLERVRMLEKAVRAGDARAARLQAEGVLDNARHIRLMEPGLSGEDRERFRSYLDRLGERARAVALAAGDARAVAAGLAEPLAALKASCNGCHARLRPEGPVDLD